MSRARIMASIGAALDGAESIAARRRGAAERLERPLAHALPVRAMGDSIQCVQRFKDCQRNLGVELIEVSAAADAPAAIASYLQVLGLPPILRRGEDALLGRLPWSEAAGLLVETGPAERGDAAGLSRAVAAAAETGTLVLASGRDNPGTLAFQPDTHIVLLAADTIVGSYEEACALALAANGGALPRALNLVTGASRTGDIGGKIVMGAHGPRRLAVVLTGTGAASGGSPACSS